MGVAPRTGRASRFTAAARRFAASSSRCFSVTDLPPTTSTSTSTPLIPLPTSSPPPASRCSASTGAAPVPPGPPTSGSDSSTTPTTSSPRTDRPSSPTRSSAPERRARSGWATRWARWSATACWEDRTEAASAGMCALGAPVFFRYTGWVVRLSRLALWLAWPLAFRQRWLSIGLAPFLGHVTLPLTEVLLNPKAIAPRVLRKMYCNLVSSMGYRLLRQLDDWSRERRLPQPRRERRLPGAPPGGDDAGAGHGREPGRAGDAAGGPRPGRAARPPTTRR